MLPYRPRARGESLNVSEHSPGDILPGAQADSLRISMDAKHLAYVAEQDGKNARNSWMGNLVRPTMWIGKKSARF